jgi:2-dehydropantoate 2-reductase
MRVIVFGAGAVGSTIGGMLALKSHDVVFICRKSHVDAIQEQKGLRIKSGTGEYFASVQAYPEVVKDMFQDDTCVVFTPKSYDTKSGVDILSQVAPADIPVVGFQNGISNEDIILEAFPNLYGGVCKMTCSCLQPGFVSLRRLGRLAVGKYPKGTDAFARRLNKVLCEAGFQSAQSKSIACDKWLKLAVNLQSTVHAIIDGMDHETPEFLKIKMGLFEEAEKVFRTQKIKAKSCDTHDFTIKEMIDELKRPRASSARTAMWVRNSTWQNLYLNRKEMENSYFHGPIIEMARENKIEVPFNEVAFEMVQECHRDKLGPEAFRAVDLLERVSQRKTKK